MNQAPRGGDAGAAPRVRLLDSTLRDGSHAIQHRYTPEQVRLIAGRLDEAGMHSIGVGHGDGLGASSIQYMRSLHTDDELLTAARQAVRRARLAVTFQPGIGDKRHLQRAAELGADLVRIATHCTEADISIQHIELSRELGMVVHGDLMMPHMTSPAKIAEQARIMVDAGATGVHIMDSAGALTMDDVRARIAAMLQDFDGEAEAGIHAHQNLSLAVANTEVAFQEGATLADACLAGAGAGAGNCQMDALVAVLGKLSVETGIDLWKLEDLADEVVRPILATPPTVDGMTFTQGFAGVPGSFLHHARRTADRFGVDARDLLVEVGRRKSVSGQEDLLIEVAASRARARRTADSA
jgi:4-hydroxy 2-oxovalerate aldolase